MKKLFFFLALLLPIGAWADEVLIASQDWADCGEFISYEGTGATRARMADGLAINNPKVQTEIWTPGIVICGGDLTLKKDHYYKVRLTMKVPSDGTYTLVLGCWDPSQGHGFQATASDDFQVFEIEFPEYEYDLVEAHVCLLTGWVAGTTIIQDVQVFDVTNGETLLEEKDWTSPYEFYANEGTGASCTIVADGVAITNPRVQSENPDIQTMVLKGATLQKNHSYKVIVEAKIPSDGNLQVLLGTTDYYQEPAIPVTASDNFQTIEVLFQDFPQYEENAFVKFQNGGIKGTSIVRYVQINDLGDIPVPLKYRYNPDEGTATVIKDPERNYKEAVVIPSTVQHNGTTYTVTKIADNAFADCTALTSITIPATVTELAGSTFYNCTELKEIVVNPGNSVYDSRNNCNAIIEKATNKLVVGCETTVIPDNVTAIGENAFWGRWGMRSISIPETVKSIEGYAFAWCISLGGIGLPSELETIGNGAFESSGLNSITLPASLKTIGADAFKNCQNLIEVTVQNPVPLTLDGGDTFSNRANAALFVPEDCIATYKAADYWKEFNISKGQVAFEYWDRPYWFGDEGTGATYEMTADGLAITNSAFHDNYWTPQTQVIQNVQLKKNHTYKVIINAKIPTNDNLHVQLGSWWKNEWWDQSIPVTVTGNFQNYEFTYQDLPFDAEDGHVLFQNGGIVGTCIVNNVAIFDVTTGEELIAEKHWDGPYWLGDEGTGATCVTTSEGLAINNPKVQENIWTPQTMVLKNAKLQKDHSYMIIVNAKIPSDGELQMQLGSWEKSELFDLSIPVTANGNFQNYEFIYQDFPVDAEDGHVLFQNGLIAGTSIVQSVRILDLGDVRAELAYNYIAETKTAEVIKNGDRKYAGDIVIPATVTYKGEVYTVTGINDDAFGDCTTLTSITIPATVTELSGWGFRNCASLEQITVDPNNPRFNSNNNCNAIIETGKNKLIVGSLKTVIPEGIIRIGADAFWGRWGLNTINIPNSVKEIGSHAFSWCFLTDITLPSVLEVIEEGAFESTDLQSVTLPASLKTIGEKAFNDCPQLTKVTVQNSQPLTLDGGDTFSNRTSATLYLPAGSKKAYKAAAVWKDFKETVETQNNVIYSYDLTAYLGVPTAMEINLENWDPFTAYQFDLVLPQGITLEKDASGNIQFTKGKRYAGNRSISVTPRENNTHRIVSASMKNEVISGNDGALLTVYLVVSESMAKSTYQAEIKNVIMTTPAEKQINFDPTTVAITTKGLLLGDSNDDESVNVTDIVATVNSILGRPSDKFNPTAADIDRNHVVDIFDVYQGLKLIKNGTRMAARTRAGDTSGDKLTIKDFSILSGMTKQLQVELTNVTAYAGFQFDLELPEGITVTDYSVNASRIPEGISVDMDKTEGVYRFIGSGLGAEKISGNSGTILNITIKANENLKGRYQKGYLRDVKLSTAEGTGTTIEETAFNITDETSGDLNKNGKLDAADIKAIAELIMKGEYKAKADVNGDSKVNAADIVVVTNEINKK